MAFLPKSKPPRPNYKPQRPPTRGGLGTSRGSVSKPKDLPRPRLSRDVPGFVRNNSQG